jgi:hypothetical protein
MWQGLDKPPSVTFVKLVPIPGARVCINTYSTIMALWAMTSHMGILLKTLRAHHNQTHCQQGSCSWACICSSSLVLHWHMHLEHQQSWQFGSSPPLCCCICSNSSFGFNHCVWHPKILALGANTSYFVWPCCGTLFQLLPSIHIWQTFHWGYYAHTHLTHSHLLQSARELHVWAKQFTSNMTIILR